jgi:hypothetical protein
MAVAMYMQTIKGTDSLTSLVETANPRRVLTWI